MRCPHVVVYKPVWAWVMGICFWMLPVGSAWLFAQSGIVCNDGISVSLDENCEAAPGPDVFLEGTYSDYSDFEVHVYQGPNEVPLPLGSAQIGEVLLAQLTQVSTGNSCWSQFQLVDLLAPQWDCPAGDTLWLSCAQDASAVSPPLPADNCDGSPQLELTSESIAEPGCSGGDFWKLITRSWIATDAYGNISAPCEQRIGFQRPSPASVVFPAPLSLPCGSTETGPAQTGYPTLNGIPLNGQEGACALGVSYSDEWLSGCGGSQYLLRTWSILDWCTPSGAGNPLTHLQVISLSDEQAPLMACADTLWVAVNEADCSATFSLPLPQVSDNCSAWELSWSAEGFSLSANDTLVEHLPQGDYTISYAAADACGNQSTCETVLGVRDQQAPTAVCDEFTVVSLDENGEAEVQAGVFDDGSYDLCSALTFAARRMNDSLFEDTLFFDCEDVGQDSLQVELRVRDAQGYDNFCMVEVEVQDKLAPQAEPLPDMVLSCYEDYGDTSLTGWPQVWDACGYETLYEETVDVDESCGSGMVLRNFTFVDPSGNSTSLTQTVALQYDQPLQEADISWPADYDAPECTSAGSLLPDSLPEGYGRPLLSGQVCGLVAVSYQDALYDVAEPSCFKIVRTWSVLDWCNFDAAQPDNGAVFTHEQVIKVIDHTAPALQCPLSGFVKLSTPYCTDTVVIPALQVEDCSPSLDIQVSSELGEGLGPFPDVPLGTYHVLYEVTDGCGNYSACEYYLQVVDAKKPTPYCKDELVIEIMQTGMIWVSAEDFDAGSFDNCTAEEDLEFSFGPYPGFTTDTFFCSDVGDNLIQMWVFDEQGNTDYCQTNLQVQDNMGACPMSYVALGGRVETPHGEPLAGVEMYLNGADSQEDMTAADGTFFFPEVLQGEPYELKPSWPEHSAEGISSFDLVMISRHILGIKPLEFPYQMIAADVNNSHFVSTMDMALIQRRILGQIESFPGQQDWVFIPADYEFPNPDNPFLPVFPRELVFDSLDSSFMEADFIAVQLGNPSDM